MFYLVVVGMDMYHKPFRKSPSTAGIISSTNKAMFCWDCIVWSQASSQKLIYTLNIGFVRAIKQFYKVNQQWLAQIPIFRDGVDHSRLSTIAKCKVEQFTDTSWFILDDYQPSLVLWLQIM